MKRIIIFCSLLIALHTAAYCGPVNRIILIDGSIINGEIVSYENGIYVIRTANLGEMKLESAKVFRIESVNILPSSNPVVSAIQPDSPTPSEVDSYKQKLMSDPENAAIIATLATDKQIQEVAKDPQVQDAIKSGDIQALMKNKKFMDIVNDPNIQGTVERLKKQTNAN